MMYSGAVVVAYNPDENIYDLAHTLANSITKENIIISNNSTVHNNILVRLSQEGFTVWPMQGNKGIAAALNSGIGVLISKGVSSIFCFDQDSSIDNDFIGKMQETWVILEEKKVGILCPNFYDINSKTYAQFSHIIGWKIHNFRITKADVVRGSPLETSFAITSGTLLSKEAFIVAGGFDESLFIDHVDSEFCLRLIDKGYKILIDPKIEFKHSVGDRSVRKLLFLTIKPNNHRPIRRYYIFRNGIITQGRHRSKFPGFLLLNSARNVHEILSIVFFENNKYKKLKATLEGTKDGLLNNIRDNEELWKKLN